MESFNYFRRGAGRAELSDLFCPFASQWGYGVSAEGSIAGNEKIGLLQRRDKAEAYVTVVPLIVSWPRSRL